MTWQQNQPGYPSIFNPANCSLISQLLPPGPKKFLNDFLEGNAFRNPIAGAAQILQEKMGANLSQIEGLSELTSDLDGLNDALGGLNGELSAFITHTNRLSGISIDGDNGLLPRLDQIIGVMSTYNSIKDLLKDPEQLLEDNFSNAFSSLNPQIVGPFFDNFGQNMNNISAFLGEIEYQLNQGGATGIGEFVGELRQLTDNVNALSNNITTLINNDNAAFTLALAAVERYALGNSIISTALLDPCFGGQLMKNLILNPDFSKSMDEIATENGVKIEGSPVNLLDHIPSLK
jgi:hypothetical protein